MPAGPVGIRIAHRRARPDPEMHIRGGEPENRGAVPRPPLVGA
jgi:hypothetical protein